MAEIDFEAFKAFCKKHVGQNLTAIGGKAQFSLLDVSDKAIHFQISKNVVRKMAVRYVERILERYAKTGSLNPGHYGDISPNAIYVLALIKLFEEEPKSKEKSNPSHE